MGIVRSAHHNAPVTAPSLLEPNRARTAQPDGNWPFPSRLAFHRFMVWEASAMDTVDSGHRRPPLYPDDGGAANGRTRAFLD